MLTRSTVTILNNIETVGGKEGFLDLLFDHSLFSIIFGIFINKNRRYTNKFAVICSVIVIIFFILIFCVYVLDVNSVE